MDDPKKEKNVPWTAVSMECGDINVQDSKSEQNNDTIAEAAVQAVKKRRRTAMDYAKRLFILALGAMLYSAGLEIFLVPNNIIDGGVVGISIMAGYLTSINYSVFMIIINIPFLFFGYRHIGKEFAISTIISIAFLSIWSLYFEPIPEITNDLFLAAVFGGIIAGIGVGIIIRNGGSLDGTEMVAIVLDKKSTFSVGEVVMFFNIFILGAAGFVFGWENAMYSLVAYFVISKMIDIVIKGLDESYGVMIVSDESDNIASDLMSKLGRGVTFLHGQGAYTGDPKKVLYCVVTRLEVDKLKEITMENDENAFVTINPVHDIVGGRFKRK